MPKSEKEEKPPFHKQGNVPEPERRRRVHDNAPDLPKKEKTNPPPLNEKFRKVDE